ncbi:MAG: preprotein translocase subunit SecE [Oscillatoria princeps RMCB-10]|jgi:preprotein translocase subunit SecE|nr:preprotein translocase subunit SecE [Oscillatoria princeps RMCB-10]
MAKKNEAEIQQTPPAGFNVGTFFDETKEELAKVVWPSRQQLISESLAVLLMVTLAATFIYLVDNLFAWVALQVFR